eukprot:3415091-Rhodomonas_salina.1
MSTKRRRPGGRSWRTFRIRCWSSAENASRRIREPAPSWERPWSIVLLPSAVSSELGETNCSNWLSYVMAVHPHNH